MPEPMNPGPGSIPGVRWFAASHGGDCVSCGRPFLRGSEVTRDGLGYRARCCPVEAP